MNFCVTAKEKVSLPLGKIFQTKKYSTGTVLLLDLIIRLHLIMREVNGQRWPKSIARRVPAKIPLFRAEKQRGDLPTNISSRSILRESQRAALDLQGLWNAYCAGGGINLTKRRV